MCVRALQCSCLWLFNDEHLFHYIASYHVEFMCVCCVYILCTLSVGDLVAGKVNVLLLSMMCVGSLRLLVLFALCIRHEK